MTLKDGNIISFWVLLMGLYVLSFAGKYEKLELIAVLQGFRMKFRNLTNLLVVLK